MSSEPQSFEPRVVRPLEDDAADVTCQAGVTGQADVKQNNVTPNKAAQYSDERAEEEYAENWPNELTLLGKQLGREAVRLSGFYPAVADDEKFLEKLTAAQSSPARRYWFQRIWFRSAAAVMLVVVCVSLLSSPGDDHMSPSDSLNNSSDANPAATGWQQQLGAHKASLLLESVNLESFSGLPATRALGRHSPQLPGLQHYRGLSGEEIEGLREFERPGTRVSL